MTVGFCADAAWDAAVGGLADALRAAAVQRVATLLDNGRAWAVIDAALERAGLVHVPLPAFFTEAQRRHAIEAAGVDLLCTVPGAEAPGAAVDLGNVGMGLTWRRLPARPPGLPAGTRTITFTSGTTGTPKGVCLGRDAMHAVADGIGQATAELGIERHLSALPYAVLLENIAGLMAPMMRGATCLAPPLAEVGLRGSSSFDPACLQAACERYQPHSLILLPQMLRAWSAWLSTGGQRAPSSLKLVAVGGAAVGAPLLAAARAVGLPAYEGYGLSEGGSVQTLNLPGADRPGSAGRPLPHARLRIAADGEIEIGGPLQLGYLGSGVAMPTWWPTGDLGSIDADGYLHVGGRKKLVIVTAYGRNVSPEWVECALHAASVRGLPVIAQAVVFGDGEPSLSAVLWPVHPDLPDAALQAAVDLANGDLPDYAQVRHWQRSDQPFTAESGLATANGRPRRDAIARCHPFPKVFA